jgi:hypothetical protein
MPSSTRTRTSRARTNKNSPGSAAAPVEADVRTATSAPAPHDLSQQELDLVQDTLSREADTVALDGPGAAPTMTPPQLGGAATASSAGAGISGQKVVALWAEQTNRNAWAYLQTAGWKKLSTLTDTGSTTMTLLAAHARATGSAPDLAVDSAGVIGTMYVW